MICKEVHKKFNSYLNQTIDKKHKRKLELHFQDCTSCNRILSEVKSTMNLLERVEILSADPFMFTRIQPKLEAQIDKSKQTLQKILHPVVLTLILLLSLFIGIGLGSKYHNNSNQNDLKNIIGKELDDELYFNALAYDSIESFLLTE